MINYKDMNIELKRIEVCDLLIALTFADNMTDTQTTKWAELHDKIKKMLDDFDESISE